MPEGGLLFSPPMNPSSQPLGKAYLEDIFSGVVSTELGPSPGPKGTGDLLAHKEGWVPVEPRLQHGCHLPC